MLDDYSLRLLAEIGVDVYLPRASGESAERAAPSSRMAEGKPPGPAPVGGTVEVGIVGADPSRTALIGQLGLALRGAGMRNVVTAADAVDGIAALRGVLVLGEELARTLGARLPAQRQAAIEWVITAEPSVLAASATAKRALWGEIKRLSRTLHATGDGGAGR